jgi:Na+-driven multidrug efflux pump
MIWTADLPATGMDWKYVMGEVRELWEEILKRNAQGILSEACDVYTCTLCAILTYTGVNLPVLWTRSARGWLHRVEVWKHILAGEGLVFKVEYLRYGSNYHKQDKVYKVLELARKDQS